MTGDDGGDELRSEDHWSDELVEQHGLPVVDVPFVTVGGGLGSFAVVDYLRIAGVPRDDIAILSELVEPHETYRYLCAISQIPPHERLRSDSGSTMDNIWGFPSYALREAWSERTLWPLWNVLVEPVFADFWTPRADQVYASVRREATRIGWERMLVRGLARRIRRRVGGGYFTLHAMANADGSLTRTAYRSRFVHVAVGYPGLRYLPDLQDYRYRTGDIVHVVNAYERHDHVYEALVSRPGVVMVRGSGIVASRVLQRLIDDRDHHGAQTTIIHVFRNYVSQPQGDSPLFRRDGELGFAYQGFNFAKAAWGGQHRDRLLQLDGEERAAFIRALGGTNTPKRRVWQEQLTRGLREGFYQQAVGEVTAVERVDEGWILVTVEGQRGPIVELRCDYIIDATGLAGDPRDHRLLADLLERSGAGRNPLGGLDVDPSFEVRGTRAEPGRLYASGTATMGGYYAPVDSFLGLQYAALQICDDLADEGFCARMGVRRSVSQWWRWARDVTP